MSNTPLSQPVLSAEVAELRARLADANETLRAIRAGEVDARVVESAAGPRLFTRQGPDAEQHRIRGEMLAQVSDAVVAVDVDDHVTFFNAAAERLYGVLASEVLGRSLSDLQTPLWPDSAMDAGMRAALDERGEWRGELVQRTQDGRELPVEVTVAALRGADGTNTGIIGTIRDISLRRTAEAMLRDSDAFNRSLMDGSADCIKVLDVDGRLLHMNTPGLRLMEIDDFGPFCGQEWSEMWPAEARQDIERSLATARSGGSYGFQAFCPTVKGTPRWWDVVVSPVRDAATGYITSILSVSRDVSARKLTEEKVTRLAAIVESSHDALFSEDLDGIITSWNRGAEHIFGYRADEIVGTSIMRLIPEALQADEHKRQRALAAGERGGTFEAIRRAKDGRQFPASITISPLQDAAGTVIGSSRVVRDITELQRAEEALRVGETRLRRLFEKSPAGIVETDADGRMVLFNARWCEMLGYSEAELQQMRVTDVTHPSSLDATVEAVGRLARGGPDFQISKSYRRKDGTVLPAESNVAALRDADGRFQGLLAVVVDLSERQEAEQLLRESENQLRQAMAAAQASRWTVIPATGAFTVSAQGAARKGSRGTPITFEHAVTWMHADDRAAIQEAVRFTIETGEPFRQDLRIPRDDGSVRWMTAQGDRSGEGDQTRVGGLVWDITDQRRLADALRASEARQKFLLTLSDGIRSLADPVAVQETACRLLAEFLDVDRAFFAEVDEAAGVARVARDVVRGDAPSLAGEHRIADFGWAVAILRPGECLVAADTQTSALVPPADRLASATLRIIACCGAPLLKNGQLVGALCVSDARPREWAEQDVALVREVSDRLWDAMDAGRAQDALRARNRQLDLLAQTSRRLLQTADVDAAFVQSISADIAALIDMESFYHYRPAEAPRVLRLAAHGGITAEEERVFATVHFGESLCGIVAETQQPLVIEDLQNASYPASDVLRRDGATSYAGFPLVANGVLFGTLAFVSRRRTHLREGEIQTILSVCDQMALALERVRFQEEMRASEERFRTMADQTPLSMWVTDAAGDLEFVNKAYCEFFGVSFDQVRGPNWRSLVQPEDLKYAPAFLAAVSARQPFHGSSRVRRADGEWRWIASQAHPRIAPDGTFVGMIGISPDVTEQRRASEREREAARQKDEFIAVLAHELRNPLAPIRTAVAVLRASGPPDPTLIRCRDIIDRQVTQMARLLDDLLDVSRLSRGLLTLQRRVVRLPDIVALAAETVRPAIDERAHTLVIEPIDPAVVLDADPARLTQILTNLLQNAAKYTDPGGRITVTAEVGGEQVFLRVRDTGIGLEPAMRERIFDLFTQVDDVRHRSDGGLGIGLGLTRRLVEMHGGTIAAESAGRGEGTTFTVTLPMHAGAGPGDEAGRSKQAALPVSAARRVLVVDDNVDAADTLTLLLNAVGCDTRTVYDGETALREAATFHPELVLLDLGLPGMDGAAVCARLRQETWGADVVIAAVTGWGQESDRRRTKISGFDVHLVKPVDPQKLLTLVRDCGRAV